MVWGVAMLRAASDIHRPRLRSVAMPVNEQTTSRQDDRLKEGVAQLQDEFDEVREGAAEMAEAARKRVQREAEHVADLAKAGGEQAQELGDSLMRTVRTHPTASILVSLGVGVIIGRLVASR